MKDHGKLIAISTGICATAYAVAAIIAQMNVLHREFCAVYAAITAAYTIHLYAVVQSSRGDDTKQ